MKRTLLIFVLLTALWSCDDSPKDKTGESAVPLLSLAEFDAKAGDYVGKPVMVRGIVDHVCKHGGKKILLVDDHGEVHVTSGTRFDEALVGEELELTGKVAEFRVDESYILQKEEDYITDHKEGKTSQEIYDQKMKQLQFFRDSMKTAKTDHLSFYSLEYISHEVISGKDKG